MTLFRKGLIPWFGHGIIYSSCLLLSVSHMIIAFPSLIFWLKVVVAYILRTQLKMNKYLVWTLFILTAYPGISSIIPTQISTDVFSLYATHSFEIANFVK